MASKSRPSGRSGIGRSSSSTGSNRSRNAGSARGSGSGTVLPASMLSSSGPGAARTESWTPPLGSILPDPGIGRGTSGECNSRTRRSNGNSGRFILLPLSRSPSASRHPGQPRSPSAPIPAVCGRCGDPVATFQIRLLQIGIFGLQSRSASSRNLA